MICVSITECYMELEKRSYELDSNPEERQAILDRVYMLDPEEHIIMYDEMPVQSVFHLELFRIKLKEIVNEDEEYTMLIDLRDAQRPNAAIRQQLRKLFNSFSKNIMHIAVFTGKNFLLNVAAKLVLSGFTVKKFTIHKTREEAIRALTSGKKQSISL